MMSWEREHRKKENALHFSTVNNTFFSLWGEQGTSYFYFSLGLTNYVVGIVCTILIYLYIYICSTFVYWEDRFLFTPRPHSFISPLSFVSFMLSLTLNHHRSAKNVTYKKIMIRSRELTAKKRQEPKWKNTFNKQRLYFILLFLLSFFFCGQTFSLIYSTRIIVSSMKLSKNNMSD